MDVMCGQFIFMPLILDRKDIRYLLAPVNIFEPRRFTYVSLKVTSEGKRAWSAHSQAIWERSIDCKGDER